MTENSEKADKQVKAESEDKTDENETPKKTDTAEKAEKVDANGKSEKIAKPEKAKNAFTITGKIFKKFRRKTSQPCASPAPIKVAILGASGPTGQLLITECLEKGFHVVAVVRDPDKITTKNEKLQVVKADVCKEEELVPQFTGCDVVFSALGATGIAIFSKVTLYQTSIVAITSAMRKTSVPRLVCMTSWYTEPDENSPKVFQWFVKPFLFGRILVSMAEMERYLMTQCDDINYTIVRPCMLGNGPPSDQEVKAVAGQFVPDSTGKISRHDVAKFMIECLGTEDWDKKAVAVGMPQPS